MKDSLDYLNYASSIEQACDDIESGRYDDIIDQSNRMLANHQKGAFYIPGVKMILDVSLGLLMNSSITDDVKEVFDRQVIATNLVKETIASLACRSITDPNEINNPLVNLYAKFDRDNYKRNSLNIDNPPVKEIMQNITSLSSLAQAPFQDARLVNGGVLRFMALKQVNDNPVDVISRSPSLLQITAVSGVKMPLLSNKFGMPYFSPNRFVLDELQEEFTVRFSDETKDAIKKNSVGALGCPARSMKNIHNGSSLIKDYWIRLANYLVSNDAIVMNSRIPGVSLLNEE